MRFEFVEYVMQLLLDKHLICPSDSIVAVCAGDEEKQLFTSLGFTDVTISNYDARVVGERYSPFKWSFQDAQNLTFKNEQFEYAFVSDGLHHCASPHRALLEMCRVARKGIIMFEARDSALMRLANRMHLVPEYELEAVVANEFRYGGLNNTEIPNYIYRWTERELEKTIQASNPIARHRLRFFYGLSLPYERTRMSRSSFKADILRIVSPFVTLFTRIFVKQNNLFAMLMIKPRADELWPWISLREGKPHLDREYASRLFTPPTQLPPRRRR